jgi:hypothetical protein
MRMASGGGGIAIPGGGPVSRGVIWARQVLRDLFARLVGDLTATGNKNVVLGVSATALAGFMVAYPVIKFIRFYRDGVILLSIPLLLMFIGGLFGLAMSHGWQRTSSQEPNE